LRIIWHAEAWDLIEDIIRKVVRSRIAGYYLDGLRVVRANNPEDSVLSAVIAPVLSRFFTCFDNDTASTALHAVLMWSREVAFQDN
jgi:hypothetical protein